MVAGYPESTLVDEFIAYYAKELAPRTLERYRIEVTRLYQVCDPLKVTSRELIGVVEQLTTTGGPSHHNVIRAAIKKYLQWLYLLDYRDDDPTTRLPKIRVPIKKQKVITSEQVGWLLDTTLKPGQNQIIAARDYAMILCMLDCGLRISEVLDLRLTSVLEEELHVVGKGSKERFVPLSSRCLAAINAWLDVRWIHNPYDDRLFISQNGTPMIANNILKMLRDRAQTHPHALRRYFATKLANNGVDIVAIQQLLGHANLSVTERYIDMDKQRIKHEYRRVIG